MRIYNLEKYKNCLKNLQNVLKNLKKLAYIFLFGLFDIFLNCYNKYQ